MMADDFRLARKRPIKIRETAGEGSLPTNRSQHFIPESLGASLNLRKDLARLYPCLLEPTTIQNYGERTALLIYMEEFAERVTGPLITRDPAVQLMADKGADTYMFHGFLKLRIGEKIIVECVEEKTIFDAEITEAGNGKNRIRVTVPPNACFDVERHRFNLRYIPRRDRFRLLHTALRIVQVDLGRELVFGSTQKRVDTGRPLEFFDLDLDRAQREAVRQITFGGSLKAPYLLLGASGTGKTRTLNELVLHLAQLTWSRVLVCGLTFASTCLLAKAYQASRVHSPSNPFLLLLSDHEQRNRLDEGLRDNICMVEVLEAKGLRERLVFCTVTDASYITESCGRGNWSKFTHLIVDDCSALTEPECLLAIACLIPKDDVHIVLSGDVCGLAPFVRSPEAQQYGLGNSLLFRLLNSRPWAASREQRDGVFMTEFRRNYRSVPEIGSITGELLNHYEGDGGYREKPIPSPRSSVVSSSMSSGSDTKQRTTAEKSSSGETRFCRSGSSRGRRVPLAALCGTTDRLREVQPMPAVRFIHVHGTEEILGYFQGSPRWNPLEVESALDCLKKVYRAGVQPEDVCLFSPYPCQLDKVAQAMKGARLPLPFIPRGLFEMVGQEWNVVIVSCVQSTPGFAKLSGHGFIGHPEFSNFAVTRAKNHLFVIGNGDTLQRDHYFKGFLTMAKAKNLVSDTLLV